MDDTKTTITYLYELTNVDIIEHFETYLEFLTAVGYYTQLGVTCYGRIVETIEIYIDGTLVITNVHTKFKVYEGKKNDN